MRKMYGKPRIYIESFQLNAAVAAGCNGENQLALNHTYEKLCIAENGAFIDYCDASNNGFDISEDDETGNLDGFCYHAPTDSGYYLTS